MTKPHRKPNRLKDYDYSTSGAYFITICTKEHKCILSRIVGDGVLDVPKTVLTEYGKIADNQLKTMSSFYEDIAIDKYVIMPNHIHLLISITDLGTGSSGTPTPTNEKIARFVSTFKRFCNKQYGGNIWQRSYYDHIIRDDKDYRTRWRYIDENPIRWLNDKYYNTM